MLELWKIKKYICHPNDSSIVSWRLLWRELECWMENGERKELKSKQFYQNVIKLCMFKQGSSIYIEIILSAPIGYEYWEDKIGAWQSRKGGLVFFGSVGSSRSHNVRASGSNLSRALNLHHSGSLRSLLVLALSLSSRTLLGRTDGAWNTTSCFIECLNGNPCLNLNCQYCIYKIY